MFGYKCGFMFNAFPPCAFFLYILSLIFLALFIRFKVFYYCMLRSTTWYVNYTVLNQRRTFKEEQCLDTSVVLVSIFLRDLFLGWLFYCLPFNYAFIPIFILIVFLLFLTSVDYDYTCGAIIQISGIRLKKSNVWIQVWFCVALFS